MENKVLERFSLNGKKNGREDKKIKSEGLARLKKDRKKEKKRGDKRTFKSILLFCQVVSVCFQLPCVLSLPLSCYFSVSIVRIAQSGRSRELSCHGRLRLFSPAPALICSLLPAPVASSSPTTPPHKAFGEEGDAALFISKFMQPDAN